MTRPNPIWTKKIESSIESILKKLDLPSRSDIETLNKRVEALAAKIEKES